MPNYKDVKLLLLVVRGKQALVHTPHILVTCQVYLIGCLINNNILNILFFKYLKHVYILKAGS